MRSCTSIDKQRVTGVTALEALGYTFSAGDGWTRPANAGAPALGKRAADRAGLRAAILGDESAEIDPILPGKRGVFDQQHVLSIAHGVIGKIEAPHDHGIIGEHELVVHEVVRLLRLMRIKRN